MAKNRFVEEVYGKQTSNRFVNEAYGLSNSDYEPYRQSTVRSTIANIKEHSQSVSYPKPKEKQSKYNLERFDLGRNEGKIGTGWEKRANLDNLWGELPAASAYDRKIAEKKSQLDATAPNSSNMNDSTRYQILQDIRQLEKDKESYDKGKEEQFNTAKWEAQQRLSIAATMDQNLFDNLVRLNELKKTSSAEDIYSSFGVTSGTNAKEQYNSLYRQLYEKYGDDVKDWLEYTSRVKNREETELQIQKAAQSAKEHPILSSAVSIPANLGSGLGYLDVAAQRLNRAVTGSDTPIDYNTPAMYPSKLTNTIRGSVSQKIAEDTEGKIGSDTPLGNLYSAGYNLAMSMGDSALAMATGGGTALIGAAAATNAMNEAVSRGASTDQALAVGLIAGTMEGVMEKVSIDSLFNIKAPGNLRQAILNILKQGGVEATEEAATTLANTLADAIIMGDKSDLRTSQRKYMSMGYSYSEAEKKALSDWGMGLVGDALGGFVSGGLFSSGKEISEGIYNRKSALDFAIEETLKPTQEQTNLDRALEGLFEENKTDQADTGNDSTNVNTNPAIQTPQEQAFVNAYQEAEQSGSVVNGNTEQSDVGDLGAKTSDFRHEVKESKSKTTPAYYEQNNVPEEGRSDNRYTVVHEDESLHNARLRLDQDYDGEIAEMRTKTTWSNEEVDMGQMVLDDLRAEAEKTGDWSKFREWNKVVSEHKSEIGRSMQALVKITRDTGSDIISNAARMLENAKKGTDINDVMQTVSDYSGRFDSAVKSKSVGDLVSIIKDTAVTRKTKRHWGKKLGGQIDWALKRIADYADAEVRAAMNQEGDGNLQNYEFLRDFAAASIEDIAADQQKVSAGKMVLTIRRMSMLSKAATVMRNLVGNEGVDLVDTLARDISVPLDMLLSKMTGTRSVAFDRGALSKTGMKGQLDSLAKALLEVGLDVNAGGASSKYENSANRTFKMSGNVVSKLFSTFEKHMGYGLNVTDEMKKGSVEARVQQGLDKLYEQGKIKDDSLRTGGQQEALYRTFQDKSALSDLSIDSRNLLNRFGKRIKLGNDDASLGDIAMPFAQVPANLADRAIDYSPVGLVESAVRLASVLKKAKNGTLKAAEQAQAVQNLGRNITGSTLIAIATGLALKGFIRVVNPFGEDENKDKAAFEKMQGQSGTQFNVSAFLRSQNGGSSDWQDGDTLVSIAFLEPFNAHLTIGAMLAEDMEAEGQITPKSIKDDTINGIWLSVLDLPMFEKFRDAYDAYQYSNEETPGGKAIDAVKTLSANEVGSLIPNAWKGIAHGLDPYQRDLYSKDDVWGQASDQLRSVFYRDSLPIKQDSFGRDMMNEGGVLNFLNANILPGQITTYKTDELLDKITDLSELTGKPSVYPSRKAPDKITVDGEDIPLNQEQKRQYQSTYGKTEDETRSALIGNSLYDNLTPQEEIKAHSFAEDYAKQVATSDINADFEPDSWVEDLKGKTPAEVADAIMLKTMESIVGNKKVYENKYDGMADLLEKNKLDDAIAITMMPETMQTAYRDIAEKGGVSVQDWLDTYAYAYANGKTNAERRSAALDYIDKQNLSKSQKTALANGMYSYLKDMIPKEAEVSDYWLLDQGTSGLQTIEANMSDTQKENYDAYIKNSGVDMKNYLDAWNFKSTAKSDKDKNDKVTYSAQNKVIDYIDKMDISNRDKRNIFLGLGYSEKKIPYWWK